MKLLNALVILPQLAYTLRIALFPTLREIIRAPSLLLRPSQLSQLYMSLVWKIWGDGSDENTQGIKKALITPNAYGVVLDIGAGCGHSIKYLDVSKVIKYIALEPNTRMHDEIRTRAALAGFTEEAGNLLFIPYGAEEIGLVVSAMGGPHIVDTLISIHALCSAPTLETTIPAIVDEILKPGGTMLFFEHVRHRRDDVAWWQRFWTPLWRVFFGGCELTHPTDAIIEGMDVWQEKDISGVEQEGTEGNEEDLFVCSIGRLTKASGVV